MPSCPSIPLLGRYMALFPYVKQELGRYWKLSKRMPPVLMEQAQTSLKHKQFHCLGGSVFCLYPGVRQVWMLRAIVSLQTISDYLDNLCDRLPVNDGRAFAQLHQALVATLDPTISLHHFYDEYPHAESEYLPQLVRDCRQAIAKMPHFHRCLPHARRLVQYYCQLQSRKHVHPGGEEQLYSWITETFPAAVLPKNEWAAATGSTLGLFALFAAGFHPYSDETIRQIVNGYFPWVQSTHILLDYFIDRAEDQAHGDLNFTSCYQDAQAIERLQALYATSKQRVDRLPNAHFHRFLLHGLIAMYGSDPKLTQQNLLSSFRPLLADASTTRLYKICLLLRRFGLL